MIHAVETESDESLDLRPIDPDLVPVGDHDPPMTEQEPAACEERSNSTEKSAEAHWDVGGPWNPEAPVVGAEADSECSGSGLGTTESVTTKIGPRPPLKERKREVSPSRPEGSASQHRGITDRDQLPEQRDENQRQGCGDWP